MPCVGYRLHSCSLGHLLKCNSKVLVRSSRRRTRQYIFPPMHCQQEFLAFTPHHSLESTSVHLCVRSSTCVRIHVPVCLSVRVCPPKRLRVCQCMRLRARPCACISIHASEGQYVSIVVIVNDKYSMEHTEVYPFCFL